MRGCVAGCCSGLWFAFFSLFGLTACFLVHLTLVFNISSLSNTSSIISLTKPSFFCAFGPFSLKFHIPDQDIIVRSQPILHQSLRSFWRSIHFINGFVLSPHAPDFVQRFRRYGIFVMETPFFCFRAIYQDPLHIVLSTFDAKHYSIVPS